MTTYESMNDAHEFEAASAWDAITRFAKKLGGKGVEAALVAWAVATDPETDVRARLTVASALVYLGVPTDAIPDFIPGVGLADDAGVLIAAVAAIAWAIKPRHHEFARNRMRGWGIA